ncbi:5-bromo-4-chloroindolyl phosphate hydrolysis family protein [Ruegeria marina]|uniref:5-bromo-4-chloroindolyl phosphate hydrolysis protein n=1 Tax=Ruegeria marina TaxID=639004 RepID=A0A1G7AZE2_9RHOB|nr:5-bromo-4-chloroindolyl phosphate hydrolysis family protein [Ruegeria marina]SDE20264.1 5-bromo-4-chloroindolyl phosphate hydrolysis protein [Ruegeria marina]
MAQRYGGKYSPEADKPEETVPRRGQFDGARVDPAGARANAMFVPAIPLVFTSLNDGAIGLTLGLVAAGLWTGAALLLREGLRAEAAYHARRVARRPAFPRKLAATVLTTLGTGVAVYKSGLMDGDASVLAAGLFGLASGALHLVAFGPDPMRDKGMEGIDTFQQNRVARAVSEAETLLDEMSGAIRRAGNRQLEARVERFQVTARELFRTVEEDPRDLTGARKFLTVYLQGARDATVKFAEIYPRTRDQKTMLDYVALLDDLEQNFAARTRKMLLDDRSDLTIEIDVLRERLKREGVRPD